MPPRPPNVAGPGRAHLTGRHVVITNWRDSDHPQGGGAEHYCERIAAELAGLGARVTLVTSRPPGAAASQSTVWGHIIRMGGTLSTYPQVLLWLARHRRSIDAVVDSENGIPYFSPLAVRRRAPVILLMHHVHQKQFDLYFPRGVSVVGRFLEKQAMAWVFGRRAVCAVSPSTLAGIRGELRLRGPIFVAPNGLSRQIAIGQFRRADRPRIVCVGRMVPHKRIERLIEAMPGVIASHPNAELHLVGDGESRAALEHLSLSLGLGESVTFHGRLGDHQRDELVGSSWVTVNPSAGEGWGLTVVEAAALGIPAVAYRVPGLEDSVRDGRTGWLLEEGRDLADMITRALRILADERIAEEWAQRCRAWAGSFSWAYAAERLADWITSEERRLRRRDDRRRRHSGASLVRVPAACVTPSVVRQLRITDQVRTTDTGDWAELLLPGADERTAPEALRRVGIDADDSCRVTAAQPGDHLGWPRRSDPVRGRVASPVVDPV